MLCSDAIFIIVITAVPYLIIEVLMLRRRLKLAERRIEKLIVYAHSHHHMVPVNRPARSYWESYHENC